jgi:hypothetical protein
MRGNFFGVSVMIRSTVNQSQMGEDPKGAAPGGIVAVHENLKQESFFFVEIFFVRIQLNLLVRTLHLVFHAVRQLLDFLSALDYVERKNIFIRLVHV